MHIRKPPQKSFFGKLGAAVLFSFLPIGLAAGGISYSVDFEGLKDSRALKAIEKTSQLTTLKKRPPPSINALRYRADSDIPEIVKILHAHGYYEAKVDIHIKENYSKASVVAVITPGPRYRLENYDIHLYCESSNEPNTCCHVGLDEIGILLNKPAKTEAILNGELKLLQRLSECGYPLAKVENREVVVDGKTKTVRVNLFVKTGEKAIFGPAQIVGNTRVKSLYIQQKMEWEEGEAYDSRLVEETQNALIDSGLFSSVLITHEDSLSSSHEIPLKIEVNETKHRSINIGVSYQTVFGPGITFGWANRNVGGMGRTLSFQGDVTRISQTGVATYLHPNFKRLDQDMIAQAAAAHESLFAYSMRSYSIMDRFERRFSDQLSGSLGFQGERLFVTESAHNGNFWLAEAPLFLRWSNANSLLNPTRGITVEFTATPAINTAETSQFYLINAVSESTYFPLDKNERVVFAQMMTFGTIWSNGLDAVPLSKRFLGGTEEDLRGYRYRTVSPLDDRKPIGGRSALYCSFETRFRVTETIGVVPFFDMGSVWTTQWPTVHGKWYKSVGLGMRFFTFIGPFRVDLAFPLDRRKGIDPLYKVLVSIGQMF